MKRTGIKRVSAKRLASGALIPGSTFARPGLRAQSSPDVPRPPLVRKSPPKKKPRSKSETERGGSEGTTQREHPARNPLRRDKPVRKRNPSRRKSEFARCYGSKARVAWVKSLPCAVRRCLHHPYGVPSENAHIEGDGMGRKASYDKIIPLCFGHHRLLHSWGPMTFQRMCGIDLAAEAAATEAAWQQANGERR